MDNSVHSVFIMYSKISEFLNKKKDLYSDFEISYIKSAMLDECYSGYFYEEGIRELFDEVGFLPDDENIYIAFIDYIKNKYDINNKNIIEVGGGIFARLSRRLTLEQKNGIITVYDPRLDPEIESSDRLVLKREKFTNKTDICNTDLLVGLMPCQGAEPLLEQALTHDRDFVLWLCEGGPHGDCFDYFEDDYEWIDSMVYEAKRGLADKNKKLKIKKLEEFSPYPIISSI